MRWRTLSARIPLSAPCAGVWSQCAACRTHLRFLMPPFFSPQAKKKCDPLFSEGENIFWVPFRLTIVCEFFSSVISPCERVKGACKTQILSMFTHYFTHIYYICPKFCHRRSSGGPWRGAAPSLRLRKPKYNPETEPAVRGPRCEGTS